MSVSDSDIAYAHELFFSLGTITSCKKMGDWTLPETALDDPEEACNRARKALAALN